MRAQTRDVLEDAEKNLRLIHEAAGPVPDTPGKLVEEGCPSTFKAWKQIRDLLDHTRPDEPPYCMCCGHPVEYHGEGVGCAATVVDDVGREDACGCEHTLDSGEDRTADDPT